MSNAHAQRTTELTVVEARQALPTPTINGVTDSTLATASLTNPSYVNSQVHEEVQAGRYCWATIVSKEELTVPIVDKHRITAAEQTSGLHMSFDPADLKDASDFPAGSTVKLLVTVNIKGGDTPFPPGDMVAFPDRLYQLDATSSEWDFEWGFENATDKGPAKPNETIPGPHGVDFTFVSAGLLPAQNTMAIEAFDHSGDGYEGDVLRMGSPEGSTFNNVFAVVFNNGCEKAQFVLTSVHNKVTVTWYSADGVAVGPPEVVPGEDATAGHLVTSPPPPVDKKITRVTIHATDLIRMDSLKVKD